MLRAVVLACVSLAAASAAALAQPVQARCEDMTFRIYFDHGSSQLNPLATQILSAAERNVAGCRYKEMRVRLDTSSPLAAARGRAILAQTHADAWNVARAEAMPPTQRASFGVGPEFAEVAMAGHPLPVSAAPVETDAGV